MTAANMKKPLFDTRGLEIRQIGIVVKDAAGTAKRYADIFGVGPWTFIDIEPTEVILHGQPLSGIKTLLRIAVADLGGFQIELIQPLYGPGTHREFLDRHGEGVHHLSFGTIEDPDRFVSALGQAGMEVEMSGVMGGAAAFIYLSTQKELGTIFECLKRPAPGVKSSLKPWGTYKPDRPGAVSLAGKNLVQVGIIVEDAEKTARNFYDIFGVGPWIYIDFQPPHVSDGRLHGITLTDNDFQVRAALANIGKLQIELLQPVRGASTHMDFLLKHGQGVHHVSFGQVEDHDLVVKQMTALGLNIESTGVLGQASTFTYMATQRDLGTIFELVTAHPGVKNTLRPYGTYPPAK